MTSANKSIWDADTQKKSEKKKIREICTEKTTKLFYPEKINKKKRRFN